MIQHMLLLGCYGFLWFFAGKTCQKVPQKERQWCRRSRFLLNESLDCIIILSYMFLYSFLRSLFCFLISFNTCLCLQVFFFFFFFFLVVVQLIFKVLLFIFLLEWFISHHPWFYLWDCSHWAVFLSVVDNITPWSSLWICVCVCVCVTVLFNQFKQMGWFNWMSTNFPFLSYFIKQLSIKVILFLN